MSFLWLLIRFIVEREEAFHFTEISETSLHAELGDYSFIQIVYQCHDMVSVGKLH